MGAKLADPTREVYVFLGDGTYLMMPTEIVTSVQEGIKIIIVLVDNHGFASIGGLSRSLGRADSAPATACARRNPANWTATASRWTTWPTRAAWERTPCKARTLDELKRSLAEGQEHWTAPP